MSWPPPPNISKSAIDNVGEVLASSDAFIGEVEDARRKLADWRAAHLRPLHRLAEDLVARLSQVGIQAIVAIRLKRLFRIVAKLDPQEDGSRMAVSRMQDIAGIRIIVPLIGEVATLVDDIQRNPPQCAEVRRIYDYIKSPKGSGYRSVHIALRYQEPGTGYGGLNLELQVRTEAAHAWASAVEVNGITSGHHIKYDEGQPEWERFFQLGAELIARSEGTVSLSEFEGVDNGVIIDDLRALEAELNAFGVMLSHRVRNHRELPKPQMDADVIGACFLFEFGSDAKQLNITVFSTDQREQAILRYADAEQHTAFEQGDLAPILVSVSSVDRLPVAYQTFFLDCSPYVELLTKLIDAG